MINRRKWNKIKRKIVQRIVHILSSEKYASFIPYSMGHRIIKYISKQRFFQKNYYKLNLDLYNEFLDSLNGVVKSQENINEFCYSSFLVRYRFTRISHFNQAQVKKYIKTKGLEYLERSVSSKKGVILLNSHWGYATLTVTLLSLLDIQNVYTIVGERGSGSSKFKAVNKKINPKLIVFNNMSNQELLKVMLQSRDVLKRGDILHILGDGNHGNSNFEREFLGWRKGFKPSFAELSIATGANIHPIYIHIDISGTIQINIHPKLDTGKVNLSKEERLSHIMNQYIELLEDKWIHYPQYVNIGFMEKHIRNTESI